MKQLFKESEQKANEVTIRVFGKDIIFNTEDIKIEEPILILNNNNGELYRMAEEIGIEVKRPSEEELVRNRIEDLVKWRISTIKIGIEVSDIVRGLDSYEDEYGNDKILERAKEFYSYKEKKKIKELATKKRETIKAKLQKQEKELASIEKDAVRSFPKLPKLKPLKKLIVVRSKGELTVTLNLDNASFNKKPTGKEIGAIQNRLNNNISTLGLKEFANAVALEGRTFKAAAIAGKSNNDWVSQDIFAIDIDNKYGEKEKKYPYLPMEEAYKRCEKYNVMPIFIYPSFSSTPELNKYRLVFRVPSTITDLRVRRFTMLALMEIFPERDKSCIDAARTFFGGCQELYKFNPEATINPLDLNLSAIQYLKDTKGSNSSSAIKGFCQRTGLNILNGLPDVRLYNDETGIDSVHFYIYKYRGERISLNFNVGENEVTKLNNQNNNDVKKAKFEVNHNRERSKELIQHFDFDKLESNCQLWNDLINGATLHHNEIFKIACSMWRVKGAEKRMIEAIKNNDNYGCKQNNKINTVYSCRKYNYAPVSCSNFCPYSNSCKHGLILHAVDNKRGNIRRIKEEEERITIKEAESKLEAAIKESLKSSNNNEIIIIDGCTGLGKTTALGNARDLLENTCIAYPSHKLGKDIQDRLNLDAIYCKELELSNVEVLNNFRMLQGIGDYKGANAYLDEYLRECAAAWRENAAYNADIRSIREYREVNEEVKKTDKAILCTHTKALTLENNNINQYIFDEDVFYNTCFKTINVNFKELNNAIMEAERKRLRSLTASLRHIAELTNAARTTPERVIANDITAINKDEIKRLYSCTHGTFNPNIKINIKELLTCRYFKANDNGEVLGAYIQKLPNKKCIILSATANAEIYKAAFPNRKVTVKHIGLVEEVGKTILHYKAFSRTSLNNDFEKHVNMIKEEAQGVKNIITFATKENEFKKEGFNPIAHFGNCTGLDAYKGQDLIVIGTPHVDSRVYVLMAKLLKNDIIIESSEFNYSNVVRNGYEFSINTFNEGCGEDTELLREIQAYFLESELVQAVGRARTLRTNATVHLFSNYPLKGCELYKAA